VPGARIEVVPGVGHFTQLEAAPSVNRRLQKPVDQPVHLERFLAVHARPRSCSMASRKSASTPRCQSCGKAHRVRASARRRLPSVETRWRAFPETHFQRGFFQ